MPGCSDSAAPERELGFSPARAAGHDAEVPLAVDRPLARRTPAGARIGGRLREPSVASVVAAGALILAAMLIRALLARRVAAPWIMGDELEYSDMAKSFAAHGDFLLRGEPIAFLSLYPAVIAPAWLAHSMTTTYELAKTINAVMITLAAIPVFLWARRLVSPAYAVLATALVLLLPTFALAGLLFTENTAFPAVVLALYAAAVALERPTLLRQLLALAAILLAASMRLQAVVLLAVLPTAMLLKVVLDARAEERRLRSFATSGLRRFWPSLVGVAGLGVGYVVYKAARGLPLSSGLGIYQIVSSTHYTVRDSARWVVYHLAEIGFSVGVIPACALIVLAALAWRRETALNEAERAFIAVAVAAILWIVVEVGVFASRFSLRIEERNMCYLQPILILALVVWIARGAPRPAGLTALAAVLPVALLISIPIETLLNVSVVSDTFAFVPLLRLTERLPGGTTEVRTLLALGALVAGALFALVPGRWARFALPGVVVLFLVASSYSVVKREDGQAAAARAEAGTSDVSWVDHRIGRDARAVFLVTPDFASDGHPLWQTEFWNRSVDTVYQFGTPDPTNFPSTQTTYDAVTGRITPVGVPLSQVPRYAVIASHYQLNGRLLAAGTRLALYRLARPFGLASSTIGVEPDGWTGAAGAYTFFAPGDYGRGKMMRVTISRAGVTLPIPRATVEVEVGPQRVGANGTADFARVTADRSVTLGAGQTRSVVLTRPPFPFRLLIRTSPTFTPSKYGQPDPRELGARVKIRFGR
jgi:hypothetical protein